MIELIAAAGGPRSEEIARALGDELAVLDLGEDGSEVTFHDTFDGLLRAAGVTYALPLGEEPPDLLPADVAKAAGVRALLPVASVRTRTRRISVLDALEKTIARIAIQDAQTVPRTPHGRVTTLATRLLLTGVRGYEAELELIGAQLQRELGARVSERSLRDEAVMASGGEPLGASSKIAATLEPQMRADRGAALVMRELMRVMDENLPGAVADIDTEFLHDYRVALRRSRAVLRELRTVLDPDLLPQVRAELKWLQGETSEARDMDVYVLDFAQLRALVPESLGGALEPLLTVLRQRRLLAHRAMVQAVRSDRGAAARRSWTELLVRAEVGGVAAVPEIGALSSERINAVYRRIVRMGRAIDAQSPPEDYHEMRKQGKELRYLLELFGVPLHDPDVVRPMVKALKRLQDVLGRHQDREVQMTTVGDMSDAVAALPGGARALMSMGVLVERLDADAAAARGEFAAVFEEFASARQGRLVKGTFGS